jgi:hypothetical protein
MHPRFGSLGRWQESDSLDIRLGSELGGKRGDEGGELVLAGIKEKVWVTNSFVAMSALETVEVYSWVGLRVEAATYMKKLFT